MITSDRRRYTYEYGHNLTVTVDAKNPNEAKLRACIMLDKRYEKAGKEPPVAWTLVLLRVTACRKHQEFIVLVKASDLDVRAFGPYSTFSKAEGDAKAWDGYVLPIENPKHKDL